MTHDPDALYRPLRRPTSFAAASSGVDGAAWRAGLEGLRSLAEEAPAWTDMVSRGMLLAAAYHSGALARLYPGDDDVGRRLLAGVAAPAECGPAAEPHVLAGHAALLLAAQAATDPAVVSDLWVRRLHATACRPQVTHVVPGAHGGHDHVLGHGDYKHHPNHERGGTGEWHVFVPVDGIAAEMARLVGALHEREYASLHPAAQAAYALHALTHVGPFAAGNGRVARAVASAPLLGAAAMPLVVPATCGGGYRAALGAAGTGVPAALVSFVEQRCAALVDLVARLRASAGTPDQAAALERWRARVGVAHRLQDLLPAAVEDALARHRRRTDLGWMPALAGARVAAAGSSDGRRFDAPPVAVEVAMAGGMVVRERLPIDAHPVAGTGDGVVLAAEGAQLRIDVRRGDVSPAVSSAFGQRLDALLDRAVTALALRAAAEAEDG